jgi:ABC-type glutathione transport system ATPase component
MLVERLRSDGWRGQIIGPHGSGKSTLLAMLLPLLSDAGRDPLLITLHDGERSLAAHRATLAKAGRRTIVIVDGYEQLAPWNKCRLRRQCHRQEHGLIVTAHKSVGLPLLADTAIDATIAARVFQLLVPDETLVTRDDLLNAYAAHPGDLRETFFDLYDLYEMRRPRKE